ncbi:MAG: sigma-70 family RNA polymerase sigma factor [Chloroflexi bacterium]|nr:MAG: sigma-70 family RNA polymerase sigma factor [Chloroflexota bacterium]
MFGRLDEHSFGVNRRASGQSSGRPVRPWIGGRLGTPLPRTYRRIFGTLITLVRDRATAEDCAQETFERAYRGWASWRLDAPVEAAAPKHVRAVLGR